MLFHEIYGKYYSCVTRILRRAAEEPLTRRELGRIVEESAFAESAMTIPDALISGQWPLLEGMQSVLDNPPERPLSLLEKRWMKTLLLDPRIQLFDPPQEGLEDVEPLYDPSAIVWYDRYSDGDPYKDPAYVRNFRTLLAAIRQGQRIRIRYRNQWGVDREWCGRLWKLEYSQKDDKFRVLTTDRFGAQTINVGRIVSCEPLEGSAAEKNGEKLPEVSRVLVLELTDWRNALERAMLHFSHLEKSTEKLDEKHYRVTLKYDPRDETELLIRVLSFGPLVKVVSPDSFLALVKTRIEKQMELRTQE